VRRCLQQPHNSARLPSPTGRFCHLCVHLSEPWTAARRELKANSTMTIELLPRIKRLRPDPFSAGQRAYESGAPFDPDFGLRFAGWGTITAQCLYEAGRLAAAGATADSSRMTAIQKLPRRLSSLREVNNSSGLTPAETERTSPQRGWSAPETANRLMTPTIHFERQHEDAERRLRRLRNMGVGADEPRSTYDRRRGSGSG